MRSGYKSALSPKLEFMSQRYDSVNKAKITEVFIYSEVNFVLFLQIAMLKEFKKVLLD